MVGWIILIVEALVSAPLWLCAHALPTETALPVSTAKEAISFSLPSSSVLL